MEEDKKEIHPERVRKTVSFTHRQLGVGGVSLVAALYMIEPLRDFVRNETKPQADQIVELKANQVIVEARFSQAMLALENRLSNEIKGNADRVIDELTKVEERVNSTNDRQDRDRSEDRREIADLRNMYLNKRLKTNN
jgi:hypothetical protein